LYLKLGDEDKVLSRPASDDPDVMRRHAQLSDVACLMARTTYERYKFRYDYGEDLDLGLRLIKDGERIALLGRTAIIHSHTRPPYYHLKRGYLDKLMVSRILGERVAPAKESLDIILRDILHGHSVLAGLGVRQIMGERHAITVEDLRNAYQRHLRGSADAFKPLETAIADSEHADVQYIAFLKRCQKLARRDKKASRDNVVLGTMRHFDELMFRYMGEAYEVVDESVVQDFLGSTLKSFANLSGVFLALSVAAGKDGDDRLKELASELGDGKILWDAKSRPA
jgi:hypothetical protein